jgi:DNA-binding NarL/FixJ family response regulator
MTDAPADFTGSPSLGKNSSDSPVPRPRLMVVDDEPLIHDVFRMALGDTYGMDCFCSGKAAIACARKHAHPVAILDLHMQGLSGLETMAELKKIAPAQQIIILTGQACMESAIEALNLGAFRYLLKPLPLAELRAAVAAAFSRHALECNDMTHIPAEALAPMGLTGRRADVALQVMQFKSAREIGESLSLSRRTVEKHVEIIFSTLRVSTKTELSTKLKTFLRSLF